MAPEKVTRKRGELSAELSRALAEYGLVVPGKARA
jgi:hypothetical protein